LPPRREESTLRWAIECLLRLLKGHYETHVFTWKAQRTRIDKWGNKVVKARRYPWNFCGR
jgi:hypothetical protein